MHTYNLRNTQITIRRSHDIRKVYVELSSECNFDCEMCFRQTFASQTGSMEAQILERVKEELRTLPDLKEVVLGGLGEPLLHPQITDLIDFLKRRDVAVSVTTNGALLDSFIDDFIRVGVNRVVISYETGDIGHSNEAQVFATIQKIREQKQQLQKFQPSIQIFMVATNKNIHDLARVAGLLRGSGVKEVLLSNLLPATREHADLVLYPYPEPTEVTDFKTNLLRNVLLERVLCITPRFDVRTERACPFMDQQALVIRWDGHVAPCYRFLHSRNEIVLENSKSVIACTFGSITEKSLLDIWNDRDYCWFRFAIQKSLYPSCIDCPLRDGCEFIESTNADCWGNEHSCADCLWSRRIVRCP